MMQRFLNLSVEVTGLSSFQLLSTGYASLYLETVCREAGHSRTECLLAQYAALPGSPPEHREAAIRANITSHEEFGPVARNIVKLWYSATWFALPEEWREAYRPASSASNFLPDPYAYREAQLWPVVGTHPPGTRAPGYASWTEPPVFPE